ncbi:hypothetical protein TNCV_4291541 [Trichonephila clavipes]|nr:hypothetical protein TNCV_4291541 [Trichonephila clavipes]
MKKPPGCRRRKRCGNIKAASIISGSTSALPRLTRLGQPQGKATFNIRLSLNRKVFAQAPPLLSHAAHPKNPSLSVLPWKLLRRSGLDAVERLHPQLIPGVPAHIPVLLIKRM